MARTLEEIRASKPKIDMAKVRATTEADIRRHMIEDGEDPDAPLPVFTKRRPGQRGPGKQPAKVPVTFRVDRDTLATFRATGPGWQTRATAALRQAALSIAEARSVDAAQPETGRRKQGTGASAARGS